MILSYEDIAGIWGKPVADLLCPRMGTVDLSPQMVAKIYALKEDYVDRLAPEKFEFVYIMSAGDSAKVGRSRNPVKRMKTLQTGCPSEVKIHKLFCCRNGRTSGRIERTMHRALKAKSLHSVGEWFSPLGEVEEICQSIFRGQKGHGALSGDRALELTSRCYADPKYLLLTQSQRQISTVLHLLEAYDCV